MCPRTRQLIVRVLPFNRGCSVATLLVNFQLDENYETRIEQSYAFNRLDQIIDGLIWVQSKIKKSTLFRVRGDRDYEWRVIKTPFDWVLHEKLKKDYPDLECVANADPALAAVLC